MYLWDCGKKALKSSCLTLWENALQISRKGAESPRKTSYLWVFPNKFAEKRLA